MKTIDQPRPAEAPVLSGGGNDQMERIRAKLYDYVSQNPSGPQADQARRILAKLPKIKTPTDLEDALQLSRSAVPVGHGNERIEVGDAAELFPTRDEELGIDSGLAKPGLGTRAATTMSDPHTRREFERGVDDMVAFGAGQKLAGLAERATSTKEELRKQAVIEGDKDSGKGGFTREGSALDTRRAPNSRAVGQVVGSVIPGGANYVGRAFGAFPGQVITKAFPGYGKAAGGILGGAAANTLAMPTIAGIQGGVREGINTEDPSLEIGEGIHGAGKAFVDEIKNPVNPIAGGAVGLLPGAARGIRGSHGQTGRDIRLAEDYGARVTPFGGARGGMFDAPIMEGAEASTRDAGRLATRASRAVIGGLDEEQAALSKTYAADKAAAGEAGQLEGLVRPDYVLSEADRLLAGKRLTTGQKSQIQTEVNDVLAASPNGMSVDDFNDFRAKLADMADFGEHGAAKHPALGNLFTAAKNSIDETEMGPINRAYHEGKESLRDKRNQLKLRDNTDPRVAEDRVAGEILRRGENTPTSGIQDTAIEEFLTANPKYRPLFDSVSLLNAKDRMGAGLQSHGGTLYTRMHGALEHNIEPLQVGAYRVGGMLDDKAIAATLAARYLMGNQQ